MHLQSCSSWLQSFTKFCWAISVELCWWTVLSSIFIFGQISKFKKGHFSQKKNWIKIFYGYAHLRIKSFITTKFQEILLRCLRGVALTNCFSSIFHFGQISKLKKGIIPRKKLNQNFMWVCTSTHYVLHYYKFHEILLRGFRVVALTRKTGLTDWQTDGRVKNIIPSATCCVGYNNCTWIPGQYASSDVNMGRVIPPLDMCAHMYQSSLLTCFTMAFSYTEIKYCMSI